MRAVKERIHHPSQSFRLTRFELNGFNLQLHCHPQWELTWIEQGSGIRFVAGTAQAFSAGDMVLLGSNLPHAWKSLANGKSLPYVATVLQFPPALLHLDALPELSQLHALKLMAVRGIRITGLCQRLVAERLSAMLKLDPLGRVAGLFEVLRLLSLHPQDLSPVSDRVTDAPDKPSNETRLDRLVQWIHTHAGGEIRMQDAAEVVHVSVGAFSRFFRRETGKTFTEFVNDVRCAKACVLLRDSDRAIAQVAFECGFVTPSHFNRLFLARMGVTPRAYRQHMQLG
jgi:AraC-like DNA-binding protein